MKRAAYLLVFAPLLGAAPALAQSAPPAPAPAPTPPEAPAPVSAPSNSAAAEAAPVEPVAVAAPPPVEQAPIPAAPPTPAEPAREPASLELFGSLALSVVDGEPANPGLTNSFRRVGAYGEGGVAYRSKYFVDPFISVGYATLASGDTTLPDSDTLLDGQPVYSGGTLHQHLGLWLISPGVTTDIWRFRLRFGIGVAVVKQSYRFHGDNTVGTQLPVAWQAGLGFNFYQVPRFRLDGEARFVQAKGADVTFWTLGLTARGDVITF